MRLLWIGAPGVETPGALHAPQLPSVAARLGAHEDAADVFPAPTALPAYRAFEGDLVPALSATRGHLVDGLRGIVAAEGPVVGFRIHSVYVLASGGSRVSKQIAHALNTAISYAVRRGILIADNPLGQSGVKPRTYRLPDQDEAVLRQLGPRTLDQMPPMGLVHLLRDAATVSGWDCTESLFRDVLHRLGRDRLTGPAAQILAAVLPLARPLDEKDDG